MQDLSILIAKQIRDAFLGGNWTSVNIKDTLADVSWQEAIQEVPNFNTLATLTFHVKYFLEAILMVLRENKLEANDKFSFDHPPIHSQEDWESLVNRLLSNAESFAAEVEKLPNERLTADFWQEKYGTMYYNIHGIIEHSHYHLGQMVFLKKMLREKE